MHSDWCHGLGSADASEINIIGSGSHFGSEVWPGINSVIFSAMEAEKAQDLIKHIKGLRAKLGKEGVKAFCWSLEEMT